MHRQRGWVRWAALVGGFLLGSVVATACAVGGASAPAATPTTTATPSPEPTATPEGLSAIPLERFHYRASLTLREERPKEARTVAVVLEGDFQAPDRNAFTYTIQLADGVEVRRSVVLIGERAWSRQGDDPWKAVGVRSKEITDWKAQAFALVEPGLISGDGLAQLRATVDGLVPREEVVNRIPALRYRVTDDGRAFAETFVLGRQLTRELEDLTWDVWLAEDGTWPVRVRSTGRREEPHPVFEQLDLRAPVAWEFTLDITRPNDPTLVVAPPPER